MNELIATGELKGVATGVATTETETGAEEAKPESESAVVRSRGETDQLTVTSLGTNLRCAMFDAWARSCAASRPSSRGGT